MCLHARGILTVSTVLWQKNGPSEDLSLLLARTYLSVGQWGQCREHLAEALSKDKRCAVAMTLQVSAAPLVSSLVLSSSLVFGL
eukprot:795782-Rhodomonas_salina.1